MEVLRLKLFQPTAHYRPHYSMGTVRHTYPLPPPSTVLGLIHKILNVKKGNTYKDEGETIEGIDLAILGRYEGLGWDYQWLLKPVKNDKKNNILFTSSLSPLKDIEFTQVPSKIQLLIDVELLIYVSLDKKSATEINEKFLKENSKDINKALEYLKKKFTDENPEILYLGRAEDLIIIKEAKIIPLSRPESLPDLKDYARWIPLEEAEKYGIDGIVYNLPGYYSKKQVKIREEKSKIKEWVIRDFNFHPCVYAEPQEITPIGFEENEFSENLWIDKENEMLIWFLNLRKKEV